LKLFYTLAVYCFFKSTKSLHVVPIHSKMLQVLGFGQSKERAAQCLALAPTLKTNLLANALFASKLQVWDNRTANSTQTAF
jgi:hypothetical protein